MLLSEHLERQALDYLALQFKAVERQISAVNVLMETGHWYFVHEAIRGFINRMPEETASLLAAEIAQQSEPERATYYRSLIRQALEANDLFKDHVSRQPSFYRVILQVLAGAHDLDDMPLRQNNTNNYVPMPVHTPPKRMRRKGETSADFYPSNVLTPDFTPEMNEAEHAAGD